MAVTISVTTTPMGGSTDITRSRDTGTDQIQGLTLAEVRELHAELGKVIEFAEKKPEPWGKKRQ